ncbi:DUF397 domain-containing protein [Streptomyces sp. NPDC014748]|uniref:DUF397 domain-containing protein n=1 Tax=Streptomyces sp. NPDC014748 TaxID=3364905 RepID=UPI0036F655DF
MSVSLKAQEIPADAWFKSSHSGGGSGSDCVEAAALVGGAAFRDSKAPARGQFRVAAAPLTVFLASVKDGVL